MTTARVDVDSAMAADAMQAAYFRGTLADEREYIAGHAQKHRDEMARRIASGMLSGVPQLRSQLRSQEAELRYLDGLIAQLDRKFAHLWGTRN
ncbi:hypothetical protein [Mycolicibacterium sp.]|uniref:hypothetical protein n=1 Tax=Mycolicibacterium sp. TaxID=2320850 RepID=UPI001A1DA13F|nr:hypothetical protein [Mycolicibacterium sp.]MBJ7337885.1 hypothetical protein [Mycolicibacterium sp.]